MEAFSLLKYWKSAAGASADPTHLSFPTGVSSPSTTSSTTKTTIVTSLSDRDSDAADDDGPFFDLEFAVPADDNDDDEDEVDEEEGDEDVQKETEIIDEDEVEERELEPNLTFSPSDDLFFKGRILQIDGQEEVINSGNKSAQFPLPVSLSKSATKFRVFLLGLKRSKSESKQCPPLNQRQNQPNHNNNNKKFFTVKFKVEEVPIFSLLSRASSNSKVNTATTPTSTTAVNEEEQNQNSETSVSQSESSGDERRNKKEVVHKYLKMVKIKASKKSEREATIEKTEKIKVSQKRQGMNLKVIAKKHLGKSKSAVVHSMVQNRNQNNTTSSKKRDDSLLQQQDGIQSAILHCKRSFNSSQEFFTTAAAVEEATSVVLTAEDDEGNGSVSA